MNENRSIAEVTWFEGWRCYTQLEGEGWIDSKALNLESCYLGGGKLVGVANNMCAGSPGEELSMTRIVVGWWGNSREYIVRRSWAANKGKMPLWLGHPGFFLRILRLVIKHPARARLAHSDGVFLILQRFWNIIIKNFKSCLCYWR